MELTIHIWNILYSSIKKKTRVYAIIAFDKKKKKTAITNKVPVINEPC